MGEHKFKIKDNGGKKYRVLQLDVPVFFAVFDAEGSIILETGSEPFRAGGELATISEITAWDTLEELNVAKKDKGLKNKEKDDGGSSN